MLRKIAWAIQIALAVQVASSVFAPQPVQAYESNPSPTINGLYRIESPYIKMSDFPNDFVLYDVITIDVDVDAVNQSDVIEADLFLPIIPDGLNDIVLFDGWHVAHFSFERISERCVHISTASENLSGFDGTVGLYLFVTGTRQ